MMNAAVQQQSSHVPPINDHICDSIVTARNCARYLMARGFVVLEVKIGTRNPRIVIQNSSRCAMLDSAVRMTHRLGKELRQVWVAHIRNCQVEWEVGGH